MFAFMNKWTGLSEHKTYVINSHENQDQYFMCFISQTLSGEESFVGHNADRHLRMKYLLSVTVTISPIVGDDLAGEESEADDDEQERIETRASDEQTLPEKND